MLTLTHSPTNTWASWTLRRALEVCVFVAAYLGQYAWTGGDVSAYDGYALRVTGSIVVFYVIITGYWPIQAVSFFVLRRRARPLLAVSEPALFLIHSTGAILLAGVDLSGALVGENRITPIMAGWLAVAALHAVFIAWRMRWRSPG